MSRAGFQPVHLAKCSKPSCGEVLDLAHGEADDDRLYRLRLVSRCPGCGGDGLELLPRDTSARVSRNRRAAIIGR